MRAGGVREAQFIYAAQHRDMAERESEEGDRPLRYNAAESPVTALGRKMDKDGKPCEAQTFDDFQLEVTERKIQPVGSKETGGPRDGPVRPCDPARM